MSKLEAMMSISYGRWVRMPNWQQRGLVGQQKVRRELGPCNLMIPLLIWPPMRTCFCGGAQTRRIGQSGSYTNLPTAFISSRRN